MMTFGEGATITYIFSHVKTTDNIYKYSISDVNYGRRF